MVKYVLSPLFRIVDEKTGEFGSCKLLESFGWKRGREPYLPYYAKEEGPTYPDGEQEFEKEPCLVLAVGDDHGHSMPKWEVVHQYFSCDGMPIEPFIQEELKAGIIVKEED